MTHAEIVAWLREIDPVRLEVLWEWADHVRREHVGEAVHLRGLVELSNHCRRRCAYCGLNASHTELDRYRMTDDEVLACTQQAVAFGYGTVVIQAGEDSALTGARVAALVRRIKADTPLAVTLSLGERDSSDLELWRAAGADRYLLRFETSDPGLFAQIHPPVGDEPSDRIALLRRLRALGYEIGSGVMIGIPGQSFESLARDLELFRELDLDMIGTGPYIPHPQSDLARHPLPTAGDAQVPANEEMAYRVIALTRILCPQANIPSTTALATLNRAQGRELGLKRGANVVMPNLTPVVYRARYEIYPAKVCIDESARDCQGCLLNRIRSIGRTPGRGPGGRAR